MKKMMTTLMIALMSISITKAMPLNDAREHALFLTDKMAYELNLNDAQYNDAYEINLDYFLSINTADDVYGIHLTYRNSDIRYILHDWQYTLFTAASYFLQPLHWRTATWFLPVYNYYDRTYFYYSKPRVYSVYRGGHSRAFYTNTSFYKNRRPAWNHGLRGESRVQVVHPNRQPNLNRPQHSTSHRVGVTTGVRNNRPANSRPNINHSTEKRQPAYRTESPSGNHRNNSWLTGSSKPNSSQTTTRTGRANRPERYSNSSNRNTESALGDSYHRDHTSGISQRTERSSRYDRNAVTSGRNTRQHSETYNYGSRNERNSRGERAASSINNNLNHRSESYSSSSRGERNSRSERAASSSNKKSTSSYNSSKRSSDSYSFGNRSSRSQRTERASSSSNRRSNQTVRNSYQRPSSTRTTVSHSSSSRSSYNKSGSSSRSSRGGGRSSR